MRRQMLHSTGRRGAAIAASAAVLCLGGALAACGGGAAADGYVAVGAAGPGSERTPSGPVAPSGKVTLVPLDGAGGAGGAPPGGSGGRHASGNGSSRKGGGDSRGPGGAEGTGSAGRTEGTGGGTPGDASRPDGPNGPGGAGGAGGPGGSDGPDDPGDGTGGSGGGTGGGSTDPSAPTDPGHSAPGGPAVLVVGAPERAAAEERWCEKVTVEFRNTGGSPARAGTVIFATHIIGGLGVDWATVESSAPLPAPIDAGGARTRTYTVCVDAWRVPLGMHVETRDVTAVLK
ncbi:hypothetical protein ACFYXM_33625 [Streptomyces sp. NPDC002476]|uniref:hypothetical protein n=1 Tax=Streptomyces sp. NPDC002476 TaxID=3364648 RepID=UPI00369A8263